MTFKSIEIQEAFDNAVAKRLKREGYSDYEAPKSKAKRFDAEMKRLGEGSSPRVRGALSYTNSTGKSASQIQDEVQSIAKSKYGAGRSAHPSRYGRTNEYEYFVESFASMTGGRPNAHGKALRDWIKKNS